MSELFCQTDLDPPDENSWIRACKYSNVFVLTLCLKHFLNLTDLSLSGPARRFAEPDLGLNCLYDQSQTFSFRCFQKHTINSLHTDSFFFFRILFCHHNQLTAISSQHPITGHYRPTSETPVFLDSNIIGA